MRRTGGLIYISIAFVAGILCGVVLPKTFLLFIACAVCLIIGASIFFCC